MRVSPLLFAVALVASLPPLALAQAPTDAALSGAPVAPVVDASAAPVVVAGPAPIVLTSGEAIPLPKPAGNRFARWMTQDVRAFAVDFAPRAPSVVIGSAALLAAGVQLDASVLTGVQIAHAGRLIPTLDVVNELGGPKAFPLAGVAFGATLLTRNEKLQDAAFTSFQSLLYAGAVSYGLKAATGRMRPEHVQDARMMRPFSGNTSFPSGHTTQAFAIVTPWMYYYPGPITYGLVAVASGTALARVARNKHWPTDVAAGAALGFATGRFLARRHLRERNAKVDAPRLRVDPIASTQEIGATLTLRID